MWFCLSLSSLSESQAVHSGALEAAANLERAHKPSFPYLGKLLMLPTHLTSIQGLEGGGDNNGPRYTVLAPGSWDTATGVPSPGFSQRTPIASVDGSVLLVHAVQVLAEVFRACQ